MTTIYSISKLLFSKLRFFVKILLQGGAVKKQCYDFIMRNIEQGISDGCDSEISINEINYQIKCSMLLKHLEMITCLPFTKIPIADKEQINIELKQYLENGNQIQLNSSGGLKYFKSILTGAYGMTIL